MMIEIHIQKTGRGLWLARVPELPDVEYISDVSGLDAADRAMIGTLREMANMMARNEDLPNAIGQAFQDAEFIIHETIQQAH